MAERKRRTSPVKSINTNPSTPKNRIGKVIKTEVIYSEPSKNSSFLGAVLAGDIVDIVDTTYYSDGWIKIKKNIVNVIGYVNRDSIV